MCCDSPNSLECQTLSKISVLLWNKNITPLESFHFETTKCEEKREEWLPIEDKVLKSACSLLLYDIITERILSFVRPTGLQIYKWKIYLEGLTMDEVFVNSTLSKICWTHNGSVDYQKTAKKLVCEETCDVAIRYKLACMHCLESEIEPLWKKIPVERKKTDFYIRSAVRNPSLIHLWTAIVTDNFDNFDDYFDETSVWSFGFKIAVKNLAVSAAEFFWLKLSDIEKKDCWSASLIEDAIMPKRGFALCSFFRKTFQADMVCFLIKCADEKSMNTIRINFGFGLAYFLDWPHQKCFFKIGKFIIGRLSEFEFDNILKTIIHKIEDGFQDYDYSLIFRELWKLSPPSYRSYSTNVVTVPRLLPHLFNVGVKENVSLVLKGVSLKEKSHLASLCCSRDICIILAENEDWNLLKFFITEFLPSQKKMIRFRDRFFNVSPKSSGKRASDTCPESKICAFINDLICKCDKKRSSTDVSPHPKKIRTRYSLRNMQK